MALTHVCVWDPSVGFRRITISEACKLHPLGVSARSGFFVCELCAQNVLLTAPGVNVQHFRHDPSSPNKECDERQTSFDPTYGRKIQSLSSHTMPLCISLSGSSFFLKMGFFLPPDRDARCDKIRIAGDSHQVYEYSFERIEAVGTTYLSLGSTPSTVYGIDYVNATPELKKYWACKVQGVSRSGSFFDCRTGHILQSGGKAYAGNSYYLLQRGQLYSVGRDIVKEELSRTQVAPYSAWYLYRIRVRRFSEDSAKFFLKYSIFLTEKPTEFYPVWPAYVRDTYFIYHNSEEFYFYLCGDDAELKSYPQKAYSISTDDGKLYRINTQFKEQLVSLGKSGALGFAYLIKKPLNRTATIPTITITDQLGNELSDDGYSKIPKNKLITVSSAYDGKAILMKNGRVVFVYKLCAGQDIVIDGIVFDMELQLFQGCDLARIIRFNREKADCDVASLDKTLFNKLLASSGPLVPVTHAVGALTKKYAAFPLVDQWIRRAIKKGYMPRSAYFLLKTSSPIKPN